MSYGFLLLLVAIGFAIHAYRTGRMNPWLWIIVFAPGLGCLLYLILEIIPEFVGGATAMRLQRKAIATVDPGREYRTLAREVELAPTVHNRLHLADECMRLGRMEEAHALYEACATGLHAADPSVLGGLARTRLAAGDIPGAHEALNALRAENPEWRPPEVALLTARVLEAEGKTDEALAVLRALATTYPGEEARCRYADLLARSGQPEAARAEYREIIRRVELQGRIYRKEQSAWYDAARRALA
ncbi:MAG TPA: tetratricopeptide repeat protein [Acetobacteraceae bacterium]|nr:tetratricopeptide repeat protein [Acetobacteraceae bacterium]